MIKKILSIFMAFSCIFSAGTPVFADSDDEYLPIQYLKVHQISTKTSPSQSDKLVKKRRIAQKSFLAGLLLATGADIEIAFRKKYKNLLSLTDFMVKKINNIDVNVPITSANQNSEIAALLDALKDENFKFEFNSRASRQLVILNAKIKDHFLSQSTMHKMGEKVLELIAEKRSTIPAHVTINLNNDIELKDKVLNIFNGLFEPNPTKNENTLKFFELPSDSEKLEFVTNPAHVDYLKQHPDATSHLIVCYQKMFFIGLLSAFGIKVTAKIKETLDDSFPECITICKINETDASQQQYYAFLESIIRNINSSFPPEKLKIETLPMSYITPSKVTINNQIVLDQNDIFNLGQRFYNLIDKIIWSCPANLFIYYGYIIDLSRSDEFTQGVKEMFQIYTGKDLPDLKKQDSIRLTIGKKGRIL